ncbi:hypothetical protein EYF80_031710 [Liparis tanakae]|uniref:Uncharacterized protein n=1 Tax=Liparis tanakae TaxID=230148 RepID=A0A4Z2GWT3_9TELE|nr:hypothetical protein EYF80_031710 [Liparis tanakae]
MKPTSAVKLGRNQKWWRPPVTSQMSRKRMQRAEDRGDSVEPVLCCNCVVFRDSGLRCDSPPSRLDFFIR